MNRLSSKYDQFDLLAKTATQNVQQSNFLDTRKPSSETIRMWTKLAKKNELEETTRKRKATLPQCAHSVCTSVRGTATWERAIDLNGGWKSVGIFPSFSHGLRANWIFRIKFHKRSENVSQRLICCCCCCCCYVWGFFPWDYSFAVDSCKVHTASNYMKWEFANKRVKRIVDGKKQQQQHHREKRRRRNIQKKKPIHKRNNKIEKKRKERITVSYEYVSLMCIFFYRQSSCGIA